MTEYHNNVLLVFFLFVELKNLQLDPQLLNRQVTQTHVSLLSTFWLIIYERIVHEALASWLSSAENKSELLCSKTL